MSQTNERTITLQIKVPDASLIDAQVAKALEDFGKQRAREIVSRTMSSEIERIVASRINESKSAWSDKSAIGKAIMAHFTERLEKEYEKLDVGGDEIIKRLTEKLKACDDYTDAKLSSMIRHEVKAITEKIAASEDFRNAILNKTAEEVRMTYPMQMAQLIDMKQQELLRDRIKELEGQLDAAKKENELMKTKGSPS